MRKSIQIMALAIAPLAVLTACGATSAGTGTQVDGATGKAALTGTVTLYTSEPQARIDEIITAYNETRPDVDVKVFRAATGELKTRIAAEKQTGGIQADVLLAADVPTFEGYAAQGTLQPLKISNAGDLKKEIVDAEGFYVGTRIIPTVIAYNTGMVDKAPESWASLTGPDFKDKVAMPNPDVSGAAAFNTAVWLEEDGLGEDWLTALMQNNPTVLESNGPVGQAVANGTSAVGVVVDYVARELAAKGSPIGLNYPTDGVPYVSQPAGVFADAKNPEAANDFIDFLISREGHELAVSQSYMPVRGDAGVPEGAPQLADIALLNPDLEQIAATQVAAVAKFNALLK